MVDAEYFQTVVDIGRRREKAADGGSLRLRAEAPTTYLSVNHERVPKLAPRVRAGTKWVPNRSISAM